jgi:predicted AAA+ superfamily ATPase
LDELHKAPTWKNLLKGVIDEFGNEPPLLVTGSARLDAFRGGGDALTGRHYFYRLHPIDPAESKLFLPEMALDARLTRLLTAGGFRSEHCDQLLVISEAAIPPERREIFSRHGFRDDGPDLGATV